MMTRKPGVQRRITPKYSHDPASAVLMVDVLHEILQSAVIPRQAEESLIRQIREITGSRLVLLVKYDLDKAPVRISAVPKQREAIINSPEGIDLLNMVSEIEKITIWDDHTSNPIISRLFSAHQICNALVVPLITEEIRIGTLIILDFTFTDNIESLTWLMEMMSRIFALVLRNASIHAETIRYSNLLEIEMKRREQAEQVLKESEERYATIVNNAPEPVLIHRDGVVLFVNRAAEQTSQYSSEEICGTNIFFYLTPASQSEAARNMAARLAGDTVQEYEVEFIRKDGEILTFIIKGTTLYYQQEPAVLIHLIDVTSRKKTEKKLLASEKMYRSLVDTSPDAIMLTDLQGVIFFGNLQSSALFGYQSPAELLGKYLGDYIFIEQPELYEQHYNTTLTDGFSSTNVCSARHYDGSVILVEVRSSVIRDNQGMVERYLSIFHDITEKVLLEKEMEYYHQELKNHAEALTRANRKLNLLSSITRHDILNQLTALSGYLNLVMEEELDETVLKYLNKCQQASVFIQEQISFTKEYEEIGVGVPTWQNISDIIEKMRKNSNLNSLLYHISVEGLVIYADPLLEKVFYTLIENSIRHGEKTTDVWFSYEISEDHLILIYEDNGVGVQDEHKLKIFLKGYGKHTGFGLFISQEILGITGLSINETGTFGKGVRFEILVPYEKYRV